MLDELDGSWTYHDTRGRPSDVIADLAEATDAMMIVVGAPRGGMHSFLGSLAGESVSRQLTRRHGRPVLIVPEPPVAQR
ncbi:universal stress protein [Mycolicibacterium austroafricanum]|uniref:Universal stress protein n=1 Tax=Mycolicibacterium austroafricanum TaxID=39687 RepID=A0ABT8HHZ5_MYCAO|nr:universal stress protein [Mycolicibacterium austroafricanum]MDN4520379.1 universal stress protein [Mycolicibacterium austroafricanum]